MALLDALGTKLQSGGFGTLGSTIFLAQFQDTPDAAVCLFENQGFGPAHTFGSSYGKIDRPRIRLIARGARNDYPAARTVAQNIRAYLGAIRDETMSGVAVSCILDDTGVYPIGYDKEERPLLGVDFTVWVNL